MKEFKCKIGQHEKCKLEGCAFEKAMLINCNTLPEEKPKPVIKTKPRKPFYKNRSYIWVNKDGFVYSSDKKFPILKQRKGYEYKYLGWTTSIGWPKKMNTGRVLYEPKKKLSVNPKN